MPTTPPLPTDALVRLRDVMQETRDYGFDRVREEQLELGRQVRELLERRGIRSVAAAGFQAPGVVVSYTDDPGIQNGSKFLALGLQTASGVPLQCDEPAGFDLPHRPVRTRQAAPARALRRAAGRGAATPGFPEPAAQSA